MRRFSFPLACLSTLLLGPALSVSHAQRGQVATSHAPVFAFDMQGDSCPVNLDVRHSSGLGQVVATDGFALRPATQRLDVTVHNNASHEIASIDVLVQMWSGKARSLPSRTEPDALGEKLPIHFAQTIVTNKEVAANWDLASLNAVAYLEVSKITYQDGSVWKTSTSSKCQFTPNVIMLISER